MLFAKHFGGVIWHLAVLPEYRNRGISTKLLKEAIDILKKKDVMRFEAWTRDDKWVNQWYINRGFKWKENYLHVYSNGKECDMVCDSKIDKLVVCNTFSHYLGDKKDEIIKKFNRVHECNLYELNFRNFVV